MKLSLKQFEKKIKVRSLRLSDYEAVVALQIACFPNMKPWSKEQFESQLNIFNEGQLCITYNKKLVASCASLIVQADHYYDWHNWKEIADGGFIRNHDPKGDTLYGIEIMVSPEFRGYKLARRLYNTRKDIVRKYNLKRIMIGGRIPGYHKHADKLTADEYVKKVMNKRLYDPVLTAQVANGFEVKGIIPDYMPSDIDSRGYATFCEWVNTDLELQNTLHLREEAQARLCLVQYRMRRINKFEDFAMQCEFFMDVASDYKADFILFPELFTTQLLSLIKAKRPGLAAHKLAEFTPKYLDLFSNLAVKYNVNVIGGSQFVEENGEIYNISFLFRRNGAISKQYKLHITPAEKRWWGVQPGGSLDVFDTDRGRVAILICYDIEFPELARIAVAKGANILFVPFNTDERYGYLRVRHCAHARAIENQVYVAIAGCTGNLPFVENADIHYAQAAIFTPSDFPFARDAIASEGTLNSETVVVHDVDINLLRKNRMNGTVRTWADRRKGLYSIHYKTADGEELEI